MVIDVSTLGVCYTPTLTGLPDDAEVEYFGVLDNWPQPPGMLTLVPIQTRFAVIRPKLGWEYKDFVLVISHGGPFKSVPIKNVVRYRDGGTTEIDTAEGQFVFPTPFHPERKPTFREKEIIVYPRGG